MGRWNVMGVRKETVRDGCRKGDSAIALEHGKRKSIGQRLQF